MNTELNTMHDIVYDILVADSEARNSDAKLICDVLDHKGINIHQSFASIMLGNEKPSFETITRCRRRVQQQFPELRATRQVEENREELEGQFRLWAVQ